MHACVCRAGHLAVSPLQSFGNKECLNIVNVNTFTPDPDGHRPHVITPGAATCNYTRRGCAHPHAGFVERSRRPLHRYVNRSRQPCTALAPFALHTRIFPAAPTTLYKTAITKPKAHHTCLVNYLDPIMDP